MIQHPGKTDVGEIRDRILDKGITVRIVRDGNGSGAPAPSAVGAGELSSASEAPALRIVQKAFDAWNDHDVERYTAMLDEGYVGETHHTASALRGPEDARRAMKSILEAFPDLRFTIESALTVGDDVLVSWRALPSEVPGCTVTRLQGRRITHTWTYWDAPNGFQSTATSPR
ncbi:MAG TPA: nuclear transport factor 2 family protein [Patescibacteria group bacterium]|nr:nuclear transport factor 2 family protein [Patescibacteria group bacterium]